ncbi:MAG: Ig-like domain-containing protein [bacterium]
MRDVVKNTILLLSVLSVFLALSCAKIGTPPGIKTKTEGEIKIDIISIEVVDSSHLVITFSSPLSPQTSLDKRNYNILSEDNTPLEIINLIDNRKDVITIITKKQENVKYHLTIANLKDEKGLVSKHLVKADFKGTTKIDKTPPALIKTTPPKNSKDVSIMSTITLIFNDIIDRSSLEGSIEIVDDLGQNVAFDISGGETIWYIIPNKPLSFSTEYKINISDNVKDIFGNKMYYPESFSFNTIQDDKFCTISGGVVIPDGINPDSITIYLSNEGAPLLAVRSPVLLERPQLDGKFTFTGLPPTKENNQYYIHCFADTNNDGINEMFARSESISVAPNKVKSGVELKLEYIDLEGPQIISVNIYPKLIISGGILVEASATDVDSGGGEIDRIELFIGEVLSNGMGIEMPIDGVTSQMTKASLIISLDELGLDGRKVVLHVHACDSNENWGRFTSIEIEKKKGKLKEIRGEVVLEATPVDGAVVLICDNDGNPISIGMCDSKGRFSLKILEGSQIGEISAFSDDNKNGHLDGGEPFRNVKWTEGLPIQIILSHPPNITYANALMRTEISDSGINDYSLTITAVVEDDDFDLKNVYAQLPWTERLELKDDGTPPDRQAKDCIFTAGIQVSDENFNYISVSNSSSVWVVAVDSIGNETIKTETDYKGLAINVIEPVSKIEAIDNGSSVHIEWQNVSEEYNYVIFIVPSDDLSNFIGVNSVELWSNVSSPAKKPSIDVKRENIRKYWSYPSGYKFIVFVYAYRPSDLKFEEGDVGVSKGILIHR